MTIALLITGYVVISVLFGVLLAYLNDHGHAHAVGTKEFGVTWPIGLPILLIVAATSWIWSLIERHRSATVANEKLGPVLHWPPPAPRLPDVYTTHEYVAREGCFGRGALPPLNTLYVLEKEIAIPEGTVLVFTGGAYWGAEANAWLMHMVTEDKAVRWVSSKHLKPGKEIKH